MSDYDDPRSLRSAISTALSGITDFTTPHREGLVIETYTPPAGVKHDQGKPSMALLPAKGIEAIASVFTFGATKYSANNWRAGLSYTRLLSSLLRHVFAFLRGEDNDPESGISHLAHAGCNILMLLEFVLDKKTSLDDRYKEETP